MRRITELGRAQAVAFVGAYQGDGRLSGSAFFSKYLVCVTRFSEPPRFSFHRGGGLQQVIFVKNFFLIKFARSLFDHVASRLSYP